MESPTSDQSITQLLHQWSSGDKAALDRLMPVVYDQLHKLAARSLRAEDRNHSLVATALVNEAYLRLVDANVDWQNRVHFFAVSARLLRRILVDYARAGHRQKRGGNVEMVPLEHAIVVSPESLAGLLELDTALKTLAAQDPRKSEIVELLCFGGLTYEETAAALHISPATVHRELKLARAWLHREFSQSTS